MRSKSWVKQFSILQFELTPSPISWYIWLIALSYIWLIAHLKATFCTHETRLSLFSLIIMTPVSLGISQETHSGCGVWFIPDHLSPDSNSCNYLFNFFISCYSIVPSSIVKMSLNNVPVDNAEDPVPATQGALPHPSTLLKDRFPQWTQTLSQTCLACSVCMFFYSLSLIFSYKT